MPSRNDIVRILDRYLERLGGYPTADAVLALLRGDPVPDPVRAADPNRLTAVRR